MEKIKLQKKEVAKLKELRDKGNNIIFSFGQLKVQELSLMEQLKEVNKEQNELGVELQGKYGEGQINLETGELTKTE